MSEWLAMNRASWAFAKRIAPDTTLFVSEKDALDVAAEFAASVEVKAARRSFTRGFRYGILWALFCTALAPLVVKWLE